MSDIWGEDHRCKLSRRPMYTNSQCQSCEKFGWHSPDCTAVDDSYFREQAAFFRRQVSAMREQKNRYYDMLQRQAGKISTLKLENNKLRKRGGG